MNEIYNENGMLIELQENGETVWSRKEELKNAQKEIVDKLKAKGKLKDSEATDIKKKLKGGKK